MNAVHQYVLMMNAAHRAHFIINVFNIISLYMLQPQLACAFIIEPASFVGEMGFCWVHGSALQM